MTTETLQLNVTGLPAGTRATLERIGQQTGRSLEDYLRELIEVEVQSQQPTDVKTSNETKERHDPLRRREYEWIHQHQDEYAGQYVALVGDRLVAHAATLRELHELVRTANVSRPFFARIEAKDELAFGGW
ncbi:MAG: hypothetical protein JNK38_13935 [Acidobacteria bacterium]|nr:hypothetical protein [Acidobacteriota bacterium]